MFAVVQNHDQSKNCSLALDSDLLLFNMLM